jgi:hypothetical protein
MNTQTHRSRSRRIARATALLGSIAAVLAISATLDLGPESSANAADGVKIDPLALGISGPAGGRSAQGTDPFDGQPSEQNPFMPTGQTGDDLPPVMIESDEKNDDGAFKHAFFTSGAVVRQAYQSDYEQDVTVTYDLQWLTASGWVDVPDATPVQRTTTVGRGEAWALDAASWVLPLSYTDLPDTEYRVTYTAAWYGTTGDAKGFELAQKTIDPKDVQPAVRCGNQELTCSENQAEGFVIV